VPQHYPSERSPSDPAIEQNIAERTKAVEAREWRQAMHERSSPLDILKGPPESSSPHYAVEALKETVAERMRKQGEEASKK
jgi:hypothetical protein